MIAKRRVFLAALAGDLPTEFLLFKAGVNVTTKGEFLFDEQAAACVMAAYQAQGVDLMIDLEHQSLDKPIRPDSADARGWFQLALRGGDLWAVNVRWAPDGARRLAEKTQRYTSPAFYTDDTGRIVEIVNCALCAMPATHHNAPLVAANQGRGCTPPKPCKTGVRSPHKARKLNRMDPKLVQEALDALIGGDTNKCAEILKAQIAAAAGAGAPADPAAGEALGDNPDEPPADPNAPKDPAMASRLAKLEADAKARDTAMAARLARLESEAAEADAKERGTLVGDLVRLGAETPATAYTGEGDKRKLVKRLSDEPIAELRSRVEILSAGKPRVKNLGAPSEDAAVAAVADAVKRLSKSQLEQIKKAGMTPEEFIQKRSAAVRRA